MKPAIIGTYTGDSFKKLMRLYSNERMQRDRQYRTGVLEILEQRKGTDQKDRPVNEQK